LGELLANAFLLFNIVIEFGNVALGFGGMGGGGLLSQPRITSMCGWCVMK
jgi:hypothetical protein